jgi:hypothetical protein
MSAYASCMFEKGDSRVESSEAEYMHSGDFCASSTGWQIAYASTETCTQVDQTAAGEYTYSRRMHAWAEACRIERQANNGRRDGDVLI